MLVINQLKNILSNILIQKLEEKRKPISVRLEQMITQLQKTMKPKPDTLKDIEEWEKIMRISIHLVR